MNLNKSTTFTAKTFYGLENILAEELKSLEAGNIRVLNRAVQFEGDKYLLYKSNIFLRTAIRILIPVEEFTVQSYDELYDKAREINWERYFTPYHTFFIDSSVNSKKIDHSHFAALKLKDAIADFFRDKYRLRPSIDKINPDYRINLHISNNNCIISLDSSGESLHKRGYKTTIEGLSFKFNPVFWNYAKLISGTLRHGMPIHKIVELVTSLQLDNETINSWKAGVARALKKYIPNGTLADGALCEECGSDEVVYQEGCLTCLSCGSSKCG
ncbi:MAG: THUMP domain-containing protein [Bacteroidales bacterium]